MQRLSAVVILAALTLTASAQPQRPDAPAPGRLVDIGGRTLHIHCLGPDDATPIVIMEAGAGDYSNRWRAVQTLLESRVRSCAYDRAGLGWSSGPPHESIVQDTADLRALLKTAAIPAPYVLVGHSMGALMVRRYLSRFPEEVIGMVLAGPTHENTHLFNLPTQQWMRMREQASPFGADFQEIYRMRQADPVPLGDRPLIVVAGTRPNPKVTVPDAIAREYAAELDDQPRLSRNSKLLRDPASGHHVHVDNPALVAAAIEDVVAAARSGTTLAQR